MIKVPQPAMALNAEDVPGAPYQMYNSWRVPKSAACPQILSWVASVARNAPDGYLRALLINCHGFYGKGSTGRVVGGFGLKLGTGIRPNDLPSFATLRGRVSSIWITACGTARIGISGGGRGDGHAFCSMMARSSHAAVVAATTHQDADNRLPPGYIDGYEGLVVVYDRNGSFMLSHDYGRSKADGLKHGWD